MLYKILTIGWNADPETPELTIRAEKNILKLEFYLNNFLQTQFKENHKCSLIFHNCHKYYLGAPQTDIHQIGSGRFKAGELPFGEFYEIQSNRKIDFPKQATILNGTIDPEVLKHYLFFFKDGTFECLASDYRLCLLQNLE